MGGESRVIERGVQLARAVLASAKVRIARGRSVGREDGRLWLCMSVAMQQQVASAAGVDWVDFLRSGSRLVYEVDVVGGLESWAHDCGCIYDVCDAKYYVELIDEGSLLLKYQHIIGSRVMAWCSKSDLDDLCARLAKQLIGLSHELLKHVSNKATAGAGDRADVGLLTVEGNAIRLPSAHLKTYAAIKAAIEKAGGRYEHGGFFRFPDGIMAADVLEGLRVGRVRNVRQETQFFATPEWLAQEVCDALGDIQGKRVLEPSAGDGALADVARARGADVVVVENWAVNVAKLRDKGYSVVDADFLDLKPSELGKFDGIIANPPFTRGQDIEHVKAMWSMLRPGGILSTIMSPGWRQSTQRRSAEFRAFIEQHNGVVKEIEPGAFSGSGTGVATVHVVLRKAPLKVALHETADMFV